MFQIKVNMWQVAVVFLISINSIVSYPRRNYYENVTTLELVHVLYRHGDRNPDEYSLYPSNAYYDEIHYYPNGYGQMTNEGKLREYKIGTSLKTRYSSFLGKVFNMSVLDVRSTDYNRTKMSAELFTAGLFPPTCYNVWHTVLHWQPIPYNYEKAADDMVLSPWNACSRFSRLMSELIESEEVENYLSERYNETREILAENTGFEITYLKAFLLYFGFLIHEALNFPLDDWVSSVYPEPLHSLVVDYYYLQTNNTELRKIISGYFIKKIIEDTEKHLNNETPTGRKMFIYSGHETNIAALLLSLEVYTINTLPTYGSYILIEVHKIEDVHGIKLFYQDYTEDEPKILTIPGCDEFCPLDTFKSLLSELIPSSEEECYGDSRK